MNQQNQYFQYFTAQLYLANIDGQPINSSCLNLLFFVFNKDIQQQFYCIPANSITKMSTATSQVQKHFQMHNIYRRSRNYYDVEKLKQQEHFEQINRRKPNYSIQTLDTRVDSSFFNSASAANKKLQHDISQFKKRYQDQSEAYTSSDTINRYQLDSEDDSRQQGLRTSKSKIKAPDLRKMLGRKSFQGNKALYKNEDQFNNFAMISPRSKAQLDFTLTSPRSKSSLVQNPQKIEAHNSANLTKIHQKNAFNNSIYRCLFDYNKVGKYAKLSRKQRSKITMKSIDKQKLLAAEKSARVNHSPGLSEFYLSIASQSPTQMNFRYNRPNEYYFGNVDQRRSQMDYSSKKRKQDMIEKKVNEIVKKKKPIDDREQLCDQKYFNRQFYRTKY